MSAPTLPADRDTEPCGPPCADLVCDACHGAGFIRRDEHTVEDCDACDATGLELCAACGEAIETEADRVTYRGRSAHGWCCVATCSACAGQGCRVCGGFGGRVWSGVGAE